MGNSKSQIAEPEPKPIKPRKTYNINRRTWISMIVNDILKKDGRFDPSDNSMLIKFNSVITQDDYDDLYKNSSIKPYREDMTDEMRYQKIEEFRQLLSSGKEHKCSLMLNDFNKLFPYQTNVFNIDTF